MAEMYFRFAYFWILFVLIANLFVGYYDASLKQDMSLTYSSTEASSTQKVSNTITDFLKIAFFGVFSDSIPTALSLIIWTPAGLLFMYIIVALILRAFEVVIPL